MESNHNLSAFNILLVIIFIVCIFLLCYHLIIIPELTSATPIVINKTNDPSILKDNLIKINSYKLGNSGLVKAELRDPCVTASENKEIPNLPLNYNNQECSEKYECIKNVVKGGGICLTKVGEKCNSYFDCVPGNFCINGICQRKNPNKFLNKVCTEDSDCGDTGTNCYDGLCKFKIYSEEEPVMGCLNDVDCDLYQSEGNDVKCKKVDFENITNKFQYDGRDGNGNHKFSPEDDDLNIDYLKIKNTEVVIDGSTYQIVNISNEGVDKFITIPGSSDNEPFEINKLYTIERKTFISNVCIVSYPIGSELKNIKNTETLYPCADAGVSKKIGENYYCLIPDFNTGENGQICILDKIKCTEEESECLYDRILETNIEENYNTIGNTIGGLSIGKIGICRQGPFSKQYETCDSCEKPFFCSEEQNFCVNYYDVIHPPEIIGCTNGFTYDKESNKCLANFGSNNFCITNDDCYQGNCQNLSQINVYQNEKLSFDKVVENIPVGDNKILMSKYFNTSDMGPTALGYYNVTSNNNNITISGKIKINNEASQRDIDIQIKNSNNYITTDNIRLSIFKKTTGNHQLNVEYLQKYPEYRMRRYSIEDLWEVDGTIKLKIPFNYNILNDTNIYLSTDEEGEPFYSVGKLDLAHAIDKQNKEERQWELTGFNDDTIFGNDTGWRSFKTLVIFSNKYSIFGGTIDENKIFSTNNFIEQNFVSISEFINLGDKVKYYSNSSSGVSAKINNNDNNNINLVNERDYFTVVGKDNIILVKDYHSINTEFYLQGLSISEKGYYIYDITNYLETPYLELEESYGLNFIPYEIEDDNINNISMVIEEKENYFDSGGTHTFPDGIFKKNLRKNSPIGYFSGTSKIDYINTEIDQTNILITNKLSPTVNQILNINYHEEINNLPTEYEKTGKYSMNKYSVNESLKESLVVFNIGNIASVPNPKIFSEENYTPDSLPYQIDRVQYYNKSSTEYTLDFFTSFKEIKTNNSNSSLSMQNKLRKFTINDTDANTIDPEKLQFIYLPSNNPVPTGSATPAVADIKNKVYGYASPIELEKFVSESSEDSENIKNNYNEGSFNIIINKQKDIEAILKYGSSELVIGFEYEGNIAPGNLKDNGIVISWVITGISSYEIDENLVEKLVLVINRKDNLFISSEYESEDFLPYLFPNNIFPVHYEGAFFTDGTALRSSCEEDVNLFRKTFYNKVLTQIGEVNSSQFAVLNVRITTKDGGTSPDDYDMAGAFYNKPDPDDSIGLELEFSNINLTDGEIKIFIINNMFLTSFSELRNIADSYYYNSYQISDNNYARVDISSDYIYGSTKKGDAGLKINTIPFYSGEEDTKSDLDETYKSIIRWDYNNFFPTSKIKFNKIIFNYNPGNNNNNMSFYVFLENENVKMLYFITISDAYSIFNRPIPLILESSEYHENSFMTPYDNNLYILGKTCKKN